MNIVVIVQVEVFEGVVYTLQVILLYEKVFYKYHYECMVVFLSDKILYWAFTVFPRLFFLPPSEGAIVGFVRFVFPALLFC